MKAINSLLAFVLFCTTSLQTCHAVNVEEVDGAPEKKKARLIASSSNQEASINRLDHNAWEVITSFLNEWDLPYMTLAHVNQTIREHIFNIVEEINHDRGYTIHLLSQPEDFVIITKEKKR